MSTITDKNQLRIKDHAVLSWNNSKAEGPVTSVRRHGDIVVHVHLAGHPERFSLEHEAVTASEWGRRVWTFEGGERPKPEITAGMTGTASIRRPDGLTADFVPGVWVYRTGGEDDLIFRPLRPLGGVAQIHPDAVVTFTPDPDYAAAVDAYARHVQRVRHEVEGKAGMTHLARSGLIAVIDDGPKS